MRVRIHLLAAAVAAAVAVGAIAATAEAPAKADTTAAAVAKKPAPYPLDVCPFTGKTLGKTALTRVYEGREVRLCCPACAADFDADPKAAMKKVDERIVEAQKPGYPLDVCVVSGAKLTGMGKPVDYVYENQLVRFCCGSCIETFSKDPDPYMAKLRAAYAAKKESPGAAKAAAPKAEPAGDQGKSHH
jgi:YHS domain-containing protein